VRRVLSELLKEKVNRLIDDKKFMLNSGQIEAGGFGEGRMCGKIEALKELRVIIDDD